MIEPIVTNRTQPQHLDIIEEHREDITALVIEGHKMLRLLGALLAVISMGLAASRRG